MSIGVFKCLSPWKKTPLSQSDLYPPSYLKAMRSPGGRVTQRDRASSLRKAQSWDFLQVAGCLGGSFIELGGAGRGWPPSTWKGTQRRKPSSGLEKRVPGPFHVTSSSTNRGRKRDSVKAEQEQRPVVVPGPEHFLYNFKCKLIEKWQGKGQLCFSFFWIPLRTPEPRVAMS